MSAATAYARALDGFAALVDDKTGIIRSVEVLRISERDPQVFMAYAEPSDTSPLTGIQAANRGAACAATLERAVVRACGESVERYCSAFFDFTDLRLASEAELHAAGARFVPVGDLYPFAATQFDSSGFPYEPVGDRALRWTLGTSVGSGQGVWVPASCVYVPYLFDAAVEPFTHMPISTGLAAGPDVDSCIDKGILEILERDALMLVWYTRSVTPRIDPVTCAGVSPMIDQLLDAARPGGPAWFLNLLTLDVEVPIISAALIDPMCPPLTSFGIAADPDPQRALMLALEEAVLTRVLVNRSEEVSGGAAGSVPADVRTLREHLLAHARSPDLREGLRFLTDDGPVLSFADVAAATDRRRPVAERLAGAGYEAVAVEVTTDDVAQLGFRVLRTVIPGMQPLDNDHRYRYLGGRRLHTLPAALSRRPGPANFNPDPHPFP